MSFQLETFNCNVNYTDRCAGVDLCNAFTQLYKQYCLEMNSAATCICLQTWLITYETTHLANLVDEINGEYNFFPSKTFLNQFFFK